MPNRYSRNILAIGAAGQQRLASSAVFVIGCGALGGQVAMLLAAAGVGRIGLADFDTVDISNLQRQLFFEESQTGCPKSALIANRIKKLNSEVEVVAHNVAVTRRNAAELWQGYDFIIDATDNAAMKYFTDRLTEEMGICACIGGVAGWRGQLTTVGNGSKRFHQIIPPPEGDPSMMPCEIEGVIGAASSTIASLQAAEALKYCSGSGTPLFNRLMVMDLSVPFTTILEV